MDIAQEALNLLNEMLDKDRKSVDAMIKLRVEYSKELADSELVIVDEKGYGSMLGVLNSLLRRVTGHVIAAVVENDHVVSFKIVEPILLEEKNADVH